MIMRAKSKPAPLPTPEPGGPRHVAIIMDGNGRWATQRGRPRLFGHHAGAKRVREVVEACPEVGVEYLTIFAFSTENWRRTQTERSIMGAAMRSRARPNGWPKMWRKGVSTPMT